MARIAPFVTFVALNAIKRAASNRDRAVFLPKKILLCLSHMQVAARSRL
jgi:hypothetical protein